MSFSKKDFELIKKHLQENEDAMEQHILDNTFYGACKKFREAVLDLFNEIAIALHLKGRD